MERSKHTVSTTDGERISLFLYRYGNHDSAIIICPGFFQSKETPTFKRMAHALADGRDVVAMDFRGHGKSSGFYTFSAREDMDLEAVLNWTKKQYARIGVLGFSLGAAIAINTVSRFHGCAQSLVAASAPCAFDEIEFKWWSPDAMRSGVRGLESGAGCRPGNPAMKKNPPIGAARKLTATPVLFIHGARDAIVSEKHSHRLYKEAAEPKRIEIIEDGGHAEELFRDNPQYFSRIVNGWFADTLQSKNSGGV